LDDLYLSVKSKVKDELAQVRSVCVMVDGWTDRYHARSYVGIRVSFVKNWTYRVVTLSCQVMPGSHTGQALADRIKLVLSKYFPDLKKILLTTCHDGASNMMKVSQLLKSASVQHCVAHALHLLITSDSLNRVSELQALVQKCRDVVTTLHFKAWMLEDADTAEKDIQKLDELRQKIKETQDTLDADDQFALPLDEQNADSSDPTGRGDSKPTHVHEALKGSCPTRWNSVLCMLESIAQMSKAVDNCLKRSGHADLCLHLSEMELLTSLTAFLRGFASLTEVVSSTSAVLSMIPLMKLRIKRLCQADANDEDPTEATRDVKR